MNETKRPISLTLICIFGFVISLLNLLGALFSFFMYRMGMGILGNIETSLGQLSSGELGFLNYGAGSFSFLIYIGLIMLIFGVIGLISFYLLFKIKKSGWILTTILCISGIIKGIISFKITNLITIFIWVIILIYLWKNRNIFNI